MPQPRNVRLAERVEHLVRAVMLTRCVTIGAAVRYVASETGYSPDMVYRWRQGRSRPTDETLAQLARLGQAANLERAWGVALFTAADCPATQADALWGPREERDIPHNLPAPGYIHFIGRADELAHLLAYLSPERGAHLISVDGIGGVGKTALTLEAAYRCLRASRAAADHGPIPTFDAIIFVSAKQTLLTPHGVLLRQQAERTLQDVFHEIARVLNRPEITRVTPEEQPSAVRRALSRQRTLLIFDNLETIRDRDVVLAFLYELPATVKVIVTTRERALFSPIRLLQLPADESVQLIHQEAGNKDLTLSDTEAAQLYRAAGGVPAALIYAIGQLAGGYSLTSVLAGLRAHDGDVARFTFEGSLAPLRGEPAHRLLMALAMFAAPPTLQAVIHAAGLAAAALEADAGLAQLQQRSLLTITAGRCHLLPLTHEYALAELGAHPDFEKEARARWVGWYQDFVSQYGEYPWHEWRLKYDRLEEEWDNVMAVFSWCASTDKYVVAKDLWIKNELNVFTQIYGYWDDCLVCSNYLLAEAEKCNDWNTVVKMMSNKGWLLTLAGQPHLLETAQNLLDKAWALRGYVDVYFQSNIANDLTMLYVQLQDYPSALRWTEQQKLTLRTEDKDGRDFIRQWLPCIYLEGVIFYQLGDLERARASFLKVVNLGEHHNWQRATIHAQKWLADIAIIEGNLEQAALLLHAGLTVSEHNKELRCIGLYYHSWARLEQAHGDPAAARAWAAKALDVFDRLGMYLEAEEMRHWPPDRTQKTSFRQSPFPAELVDGTPLTFDFHQCSTWLVS